VLCLAASGGLAAFALAHLWPPTCLATAVLRPVALGEGSAKVAFESVMSPIGVAEGSAALEDLVLLFRSRDLTDRVFRAPGAWTRIAPKRFDPVRGTLRPTLWERATGSAGPPRAPDMWDAVRAAGSRLGVSANVRLGTVTVSFEAPAPEAATAILKSYLENGRDQLQERVLHRERRNASFLAEEIARIGDPILSRSLYDLYAETLRKEMLAHNRARIGFTVVDEPWSEIPRPGQRSARAASLTVLATLLVAVLYHLETPAALRRAPAEPC